MCRYSDPDYRSVYACFDCRVAWKGPRPSSRANPQNGSTECSKCHKEGLNMGRDFTAPRQTQKAQWKKLFLMTRNGTKARMFDSCGCGGGSKMRLDRTLADVKDKERQRQRAPRPSNSSLPWISKHGGSYEAEEKAKLWV